MSNCIFCKIVAGEIPSKKVYEDDVVIAFHDIEPQSPVHVLVVPKKHIAGVNELTAEDEAIAMPDWAGVEVTHLPRYYNLNLASHPYRLWSVDERMPGLATR